MGAVGTGPAPTSAPRTMAQWKLHSLNPRSGNLVRLIVWISLMTITDHELTMWYSCDWEFVSTTRAQGFCSLKHSFLIFAAAHSESCDGDKPIRNAHLCCPDARDLSPQTLAGWWEVTPHSWTPPAYPGRTPARWLQAVCLAAQLSMWLVSAWRSSAQTWGAQLRWTEPVKDTR